MTKTLMTVLKKDAQVCVSFTPGDVSALQSILMRHLTKEIKLDDRSWETIEQLCTRIDDCAATQDQIENKEVEF